MEEKKVSDETVEATNKDIAILNQKIEKLEKDLQEITEEKLNLVIQNCIILWFYKHKNY